MSYGISSLCANSFDPSVSGLAGNIGIQVGTVDGSKAWQKWGAGNTQWTPLHPVSTTFGAPCTAWDTSALIANLACDTLGGFKVLFQGTVNADTNLSLRVNAAALAAQQGYWLATSGFTSGVFLAALVGISVKAGPFTVAVECEAWKSGNNYQLFRAESAFKNAGGAFPAEVFSTLISLTALPVPEIGSVGLSASTAGALDATCQATLTRI